MLSLQVSSVAKKEDLTVPEDTSLEEALEVMTRNNEGTVVLTRGDKPVAIITERDVVRIIYEDIPLSSPTLSQASEPVITVREDRNIGYALNVMIDNNIRRVVVVDSNDRFAGVITQQSLIKELEAEFYQESLKVSHLLRNKPPLQAIPPDAIISEALEGMLANNIGVLPVVDGNELVGIITERDVLHLATQKVSMKESIIKHAAKPVYSVHPDCLIEEVVETMIQRDFRRVVVVDQEGVAYGILTNRDIFRHIEKNYNSFLETKVKHAKDVLNYLPEIILEVIKVNDEEVIRWGNKKANDIFGDNLVDKPITDYIEPEVWKKIHEAVLVDVEAPPLKLELGNGFYEVSAYHLLTLNHDHIQLILKDITELEEMNRSLQRRVDRETQKRIHHEQLLIHQSKLAEMGEMIGVITHQWKQPLNSLSLIIQDMEAAFDFGEIDKKYLEEVVNNSIEQIQFMNTTIDDFRNFFKPSKIETVFRVEEAFKQVASILSPQMKRNSIDVKLDLKHSEAHQVRGMENEFKQVILNLLNNSKDAIIDRRKRGDLKPEEVGLIVIGTEVRGSTILIRVRDNGGGITESALEHVFAPYFTTKLDTLGTGIGLHMCKIIIEEKMMGRINAENEGNGAIFTIELPLS